MCHKFLIFFFVGTLSILSQTDSTTRLTMTELSLHVVDVYDYHFEMKDLDANDTGDLHFSDAYTDSFLTYEVAVSPIKIQPIEDTNFTFYTPDNFHCGPLEGGIVRTVKAEDVMVGRAIDYVVNSVLMKLLSNNN